MRIYKAAPHPTTGRVRYGVDYSDPDTGERVRRVVGSREQAMQALAKISETHFEAKWLGVRRRTLTLDELRALQLARGAAKRSLKTDENRWKAIVAHFGGEKRVDHIRPSDVTSFRAAMLEAKTYRGTVHSPASVNRMLALLRSAFRIAVEEHAVKVSPFQRGMMLDEANERDRVATAEEIAELCTTTDEELRLAIVLALETGARLGEIVSMDRPSIDKTRRLAKLTRTKTDRGRKRGRSVPLSPKALDAIASHPGVKLFTIKPSTITRRFAELVRKLEITDLRFHDLRHTAATRMALDGVDVYRLARIFGWSSLEMAQRYVNLADDQLGR